MDIDYKALSVEELNSVVSQATTAISQRRDLEIAEIQGEVVSLVEARGYSIEDIFPTGGKGKQKTKSKLAPTHQDPSNPSNTWTGRGRKPKWLAEALGSGAEIESFII
jgi:DNA-binding protein H-NS